MRWNHWLLWNVRSFGNISKRIASFGIWSIFIWPFLLVAYWSEPNNSMPTPFQYNKINWFNNATFPDVHDITGPNWLIITKIIICNPRGLVVSSCTKGRSRDSKSPCDNMKFGIKSPSESDKKISIKITWATSHHGKSNWRNIKIIVLLEWSSTSYCRG